MPLQHAIQNVLGAYRQASEQAFTGHPLAAFIRNDLARAVDFARTTSPAANLFSVASSAGQGNWARVPWTAIYHRLVTESAQRGYYVVLLFRADLSGFYISLNQGVTTVREQYGANALDALRTRATDFAARLAPALEGLHVGPIDLRAPVQAGLATAYEAGAVCSRFYAAEGIPPDAELYADIRRFLDLYVLLERNLADAVESDDESEQGGPFVEDASLYRYHRRIERNRALSAAVKKRKGYRCEACGFQFSENYREIGEEFIEAHHKRPISSLTAGPVLLDPEADFAVLCSNCHRMIHRVRDCLHDIDRFRAEYVRVSYVRPSQA